MNTKQYLFILVLVVSSFATAQHQEINEGPKVWKEKSNKLVDTTTFLGAFKNGHFKGHFRNFFMKTINDGSLTDYYANGLGGGVKFETSKFKNFQFGVSGYYIYNMGSSDFTVKDPITNLPNRYEVALFDIQNTSTTKNMSRLEELYLKYNYKKSVFTLGKQLINTAFINLQDGRMRPTEVDGIWVDFNEIKKTTINVGYIYGISPRSTLQHFKVEQSVGIYPMGLNPDGTKSDYAGNLQSKGVFIAGVQREMNSHFKLLLWNQYVENMFNSALVQTDFNYAINKGSKLFFGLQAILQHAVNDGGNENQAKTYFSKNGASQTFGGNFGYKDKSIEISINYNRITASGRYLMPREWGRDPFYTFMARERNEGFGDVHALVAKFNYKDSAKRLKVNFGVGYFDMPDVKNFELNKYGMPSYLQSNIDIRHEFKGLLDGFDAQLLYVYKLNVGETYGSSNYIFNKTNMSNINFILNFHF